MPAADKQDINDVSCGDDGDHCRNEKIPAEKSGDGKENADGRRPRTFRSKDTQRHYPVKQAANKKLVGGSRKQRKKQACVL